MARPLVQKWILDLRAGVHLLCGELHGQDDVVIAGATAEVSGKPLPDLSLCRIGVFRQQIEGRHYHPWCAETALKPMLFPESFLNGMKRAVIRRQTFERRDISAVCLNSEHSARFDRIAI